MKELQELAMARYEELSKQKKAVDEEMKPLKEYLEVKGTLNKRGRKAGD